MLTALYLDKKGEKLLPKADQIVLRDAKPGWIVWALADAPFDGTAQVSGELTGAPV